MVNDLRQQPTEIRIQTGKWCEKIDLCWRWGLLGWLYTSSNGLIKVLNEHRYVYTIPETNMAPENRPSHMETHLPTLNSQMLLLLLSFREGIYLPSQQHENKIMVRWIPGQQELGRNEIIWKHIQVPIPSMYGIFTYIYHTNQPNVGKYTKHGSYGV